MEGNARVVKSLDIVKILKDIRYLKLLASININPDIETKFKIKGDNSIIQAIILVGLQTNLIDKLNFITQEHPIRLFKFF